MAPASFEGLPPSVAGKRVAVIGGGPGGYVAAIRAAQLGGVVTLIEKGPLGGVCLNAGCIPAKVLLHTAKIYETVRDGQAIGLRAENLSVDWPGLMERKKAVTDTLVGGVETLMATNGVTLLRGEGKLQSSGEVSVAMADGGKKSLFADSIIIAAGSEPVIPPVPGIDAGGVITSTEALSLEELPVSAAIVGGGVIGMEFAGLLSSLGVKVTVIEMLPEILPMFDSEVVAVLKGVLEGKGAAFHTSSRVQAVEKKGGMLALSVETPEGLLQLEAEKVLLSTGRRAVTRGLGLEERGIKVEQGRIKVNNRMETSVSGVYAVGDCASPVMLAHVASREGEIAAENALGLPSVMDYKTVPSAVYTSTEIASVGLTEKEALEKGYRVKVGRFPLMANGKSIILGESEGLVKFVVDEKYDEILGMHMAGPNATELIAEGALALRLEATVDEILTTVHGHPTVGEAVLEAAMAVYGRALSLPKKQ